MLEPVTTEIFTLTAVLATTDRSTESFSKQMGRHGRITSAGILMAAATNTRRGETHAQLFLVKTAPGGVRLVCTLGFGYAYNSGYVIGGCGSVPFDSTD